MTTNYGVNRPDQSRSGKVSFVIEVDKSFEFATITHPDRWLSMVTCIEMGKEMFPAWEERLNRL